MKLYILLITSLLYAVFISCNRNVEDSKTPLKDSLMEDTAINVKKDSTKVLCSNSILHHFSNSETSDTLKISIIGNNLQHGTAVFQIITSKGDIIYLEKFESYLLVFSGLNPNANKIKQDSIITNAVTIFFNEENFTNPAIEEKVTFSEHYSAAEIWNDIKSDKSAIGFYYLVGEEDGRRIAYSKTLKKVVMYFNCC